MRLLSANSFGLSLSKPCPFLETPASKKSGASTSSERTASDAKDDPLALYVHWPFCVRRCPYCDFNAHVREQVDQPAWRAALLADLANERECTGPRTLGSIFFGGGTPSLMPPATAAAVIDAAVAAWTPAPGLEITLEANPSSVEASNFAELAVSGVNRVSLGLQALDDGALRSLGRVHDLAEGLAALDRAQAVFERVSVDLIYARPGQTVAMWSAELARALAFGTEHLSLYQLTVEPGTRFETERRLGRLVELGEDAAADLWEVTQSLTGAAGRSAYEVSNHAAPGAESRHNLTYWRGGDYVGIGPGAHGRRTGQATERHRKPENYLAAVARNGHGVKEERRLGVGERATEVLLTALRLTEGVDLSRKVDGVRLGELVNREAVQRLLGLGLVMVTDEWLRVTLDGLPVLNSVTSDLLA